MIISRKYAFDGSVDCLDNLHRYCIRLHAKHRPAHCITQGHNFQLELTVKLECDLLLNKSMMQLVPVLLPLGTQFWWS